MLNHDYIQQALAERETHATLRHLHTRPLPGGTFTQNGKTWLNLSSNDYLDLARHPSVIEGAKTALDRYGAGAGASRLVTGTLPLHLELETALAKFKGTEDALLFGSGYMANAGIAGALFQKDHLVFADKLIHASIIDAVQRSPAKLIRFAHNDIQHLASSIQKHHPAKSWIIVESIYSMDGDPAPLTEIAALAKTYNAGLIVDEAHAIGIFGSHGSGLVNERNLTNNVDICIGTLSKALGTYGGFVTCTTPVKKMLINQARSFIYTTAPPPPTLGAAFAALQLLKENPTWGQELLTRANQLRSHLNENGLNTLHSQSPIIPILIGDNQMALRFAEELTKHHIIATPIRPPTVPQGTARIRLTITRAHTEEHLDHAAETIIKIKNQLGL